MPDTWMTLAQAAASLNVHPRTIERRIAGGKIQARRADDGQLQVLVALPDTSDTAPDSALETVRELAADQVILAKGSASALVKFAQDDAMRSRDELVLVRQDAGRARHSALAAWCVVAAMSIGVCVAVGWTAQRIAASQRRRPPSQRPCRPDRSRSATPAGRTGCGTPRSRGGAARQRRSGGAAGGVHRAARQAPDNPARRFFAAVCEYSVGGVSGGGQGTYTTDSRRGREMRCSFIAWDRWHKCITPL